MDKVRPWFRHPACAAVPGSAVRCAPAAGSGATASASLANLFRHLSRVLQPRAPVLSAADLRILRPPFASRRRAGLALAVFVLLSAMPGAVLPLLAQSAIPSTEHKVKAAFLYKFAGYVEWPRQVFARPDSAIVIGVAGSSVVANELAQLVRDRLVDGRRIAVQHVPGGDAVAGVHVLFVGAGAQPAELLSAARGRPILTVSETDEAFGAGGIINLLVAHDKVRFDVSLRSAEANNLKISSRLLGVARKVVGGPS